AGAGRARAARRGGRAPWACPRFGAAQRAHNCRPPRPPVKRAGRKTGPFPATPAHLKRFRGDLDGRVGKPPVFEPLRRHSARPAAAGPHPVAAFLAAQEESDAFAFVNLCAAALAGRGGICSSITATGTWSGGRPGTSPGVPKRHEGAAPRTRTEGGRYRLTSR